MNAAFLQRLPLNNPVTSRAVYLGLCAGDCVLDRRRRGRVLHPDLGLELVPFLAQGVHKVQ